MEAWLKTCGVLALAAGGSLIGAWFSRLSGKRWLVGYFLPLILILFCALPNFDPSLSLIPPVSWVTAGRTKYVITGFVVAMILTVSLKKLPKRREQIALFILLFVIVMRASALPFLEPFFNHEHLKSLPTTMDENGICLQGTPYTCGPAAAVTVLRRFGIDAKEGELAIAASSSSAEGTPADILSDAINRLYGSEGVVAEYCVFKSVAELKKYGMVLAVVKFNFYEDHFVSVIGSDEQGVTIGDPLSGMIKLSDAEFEAKWRFEGVVVAKTVVN